LLRVSAAGVLRKISDFPLTIYKALRWLAVASKNLSESCFASAVATNKAYFVALIHAKIDSVHQDSGTDSDLEVAHADHQNSKRGD
jgi:hypothetical protein